MGRKANWNEDTGLCAFSFLMVFEAVRRLSLTSLEVLGLRRTRSDCDRRKRRRRSTNSDSVNTAYGPALLPNPSQPTPPETTLEEKLSRATAENMDGLLAMETQIRVDEQRRRASLPGSFRHSHVTFNLPPKPIPVAHCNREPNQQSLQQSRVPPEDTSRHFRPRNSNLVLRINSGTDEGDKRSDITVGSYVRLVLRPVLTLGRVRYIEPCSPTRFEQLVGVELTDGGNFDTAIQLCLAYLFTCLYSRGLRRLSRRRQTLPNQKPASRVCPSFPPCAGREHAELDPCDPLFFYILYFI
ncbi:hypothetical protein CLU79DRAFT_359326 [Phycomyces nitens]|nr:hypothetical protein CLU79DRAFT_359326 [Phycomyces nitens]